MNGDVIHLLPCLAVAGAVGIFVAVIVVRPVVRGLVSRPDHLIYVAAGGVAIALLVPALLLVFEQTQHLRQKGLTEVGSAAFGEPPTSESAATALEGALRPGDSWASVTELGRCADVDLYLFYWLAFRLIPNAPDCADPDVELFWRIDPPPGAEIVDRGPSFAVVRR